VNLHATLADLLRYPDGTGRVAAREAAEALPAPLAGFVAPLRDALRTAPQAELEERYTATFDLDPACSLEVGWHIHGEDYARGAFLVRMRALLRELGIAEEAGLPDHLAHALRALGRMPSADADALSRGWVLPAVETMRKRFEGEPHVYGGVLDAVATFLRERHGEAEPVTGSQSREPYAAGCGGCALAAPGPEGGIA